MSHFIIALQHIVFGIDYSGDSGHGPFVFRFSGPDFPDYTFVYGIPYDGSSGFPEDCIIFLFNRTAGGRMAEAERLIG